MAKKFAKVASRFRLSGVGLFNGATVLVSKDAIYLVVNQFESEATAGALGVAGAFMALRGEKKRRANPLYHDLKELRVTREKSWPAHKSGPVFVILKRKVTAWSLSKMQGLVVEVGEHKAKIDVGLTGQGRASEALKQHGWNAVKDGAPDAGLDDEDEWDESADEGGEWDEYADESGESEDEYEEEWDEPEEQPRRRPAASGGRKRPARRGGRGRNDRRNADRDAAFRKKMLLNYLLPGGVGLTVAVIVIFFKVIGGGDAPAPPNPRPNPIARELPARPAIPAPDRNPIAQANPIPAVPPEDAQPAPVEPPKKPDPIVSTSKSLKRLQSWGPQLQIRNIALSADGMSLAGTRDNNVGLWTDPSGEPSAAWPLRSVRFIRVSPDGQHVAVGNTTAFAVHRVEDGGQVWEGPSRNPRPGALWSHDGSRIAAFKSSDGIDVRTAGGEAVWNIRLPSMTSIDGWDFTRDGKALVVVSQQKLQALNADTGQVLDVRELDRSLGSNCQVSAIGQRILFPNYEGTKVLDYSEKPGGLLPGIGPPAQLAEHLQVSASGMIAANVKGKTVTVWNTTTGAVIDELTVQQWSVSEFALSADGRRVAITTSRRRTASSKYGKSRQRRRRRLTISIRQGLL